MVNSLIDKIWVGQAGSKSRDNTLKSLNIHHWLTNSKQEGFFLSLDMERAFDQLAWDSLMAVLQEIGLGSLLTRFIMALSANPTAKVRVNGHLSNASSISNGTWQGCNLSLLLFILTLEPSLHHLRANEDIQGVTVAGCQYKLMPFADDILLFLSEPHITFPNLLKDFQFFQYVSNFPHIAFPTQQVI